MKLMLKQYLASLNERDELDVVLPDILSELGFNVISRPKRGTTQYGVDVAAIGPHPTTGENALYLLSIKAGNLGRSHWEDGSQALRVSLDQILEVYIPTHVAARHKDLPIVIALCFGGDIQEEVRLRVQKYMDKNMVAGKVEFIEWNGDKIAEMMVSGLLREKMFPKEMQASFRKALAFVDEPSVCVAHFSQLLWQLFDDLPKNHETLMRKARQIYIAAWNVFVWARDAQNLEAAYRTSELAALWMWDLGRRHVADSAKGREVGRVMMRCVHLHQMIAEQYILLHVDAYSEVENGLAIAVQSRAPIDVNLRVFEVLGRAALHGLWVLNARENVDKGASVEVRAAADAGVARAHRIVRDIIRNNRVLECPVRDDHAIEITLAAMFLARCDDLQFLAGWIESVFHASAFAYRTGGAYPCILREYSQLALHPQRSEAYRKDVTAGSDLYPTVALWLALLQNKAALGELAEFQAKHLSHCTWQFWLPDEISEDHLYRNTKTHGAAITDIKLSGGEEKLIEQVNLEIQSSKDFGNLSAVRFSHDNLVLVACRLYRLPIPLHFLAGKADIPEASESQTHA
ncbi:MULTISPECIES: hypothetical protein [Agrobacterium]|uniref:hypothetical protein n=1 Tax=Agrobacterium tumefaciens TaxID=358 RepID=UPI0015729B8C|nr:hypothetical protein [Agrobacterium tumefaciens]NSZ06318.1 hypothetical protein [Agrobacterium tumefaciens]